MANTKRLIVGLVVLFAGLMLTGCGPSRVEFVNAVKDGNIKQVESMLAKKPQLVNVWIQIPGTGFGSALELAAESGHVEIVESLIEHGARVNRTRNRNVPSALHRAAAIGHKDIVELLLAEGADINTEFRHPRTKENITPHDWAEENDHKEVAEILRKHAKAVEEIFNAVKRGNLATVISMLQDKPVLLQNTSSDPNNNTILHQATISGQKEIAEFLIFKGMSVHVKNKYRDMPLHLAAKAGHKDLVKFFLNKGADADIDARGWRYYTPLFFTVENGNTEVVKFLCSKGANVNSWASLYNQGPTPPLFVAAEKGYPEIVQILITNGANVNGKIDWSLTPYDTIRDFDDFLRLLFSGSANYQKKHHTGYTSPLIGAAEKGHHEIVKILIANGANVNIESGYFGSEQTPLDIAVRGGHKEVAELLREHGAVE